MSYSSGMSLSDDVVCGAGLEVVILRFGCVLRKFAKLFSNWYLLLGSEKVIIANDSNCLKLVLGVMICVLNPAEGETNSVTN